MPFTRSAVTGMRPCTEGVEVFMLFCLLPWNIVPKIIMACIHRPVSVLGLFTGRALWHIKCQSPEGKVLMGECILYAVQPECVCLNQDPWQRVLSYHNIYYDGLF